MGATQPTVTVEDGKKREDTRTSERLSSFHTEVARKWIAAPGLERSKMDPTGRRLQDLLNERQIIVYQSRTSGIRMKEFKIRALQHTYIGVGDACIIC